MEITAFDPEKNRCISSVSDPVIDQLKAIRKENAEIKEGIEEIKETQYMLMDVATKMLKHWADELSKSILANCDVGKKQ